MESNEGVSSEDVANPQAEEQTSQEGASSSSDQEINWKKANEALSEQKAEAKALREQNQLLQQQMQMVQYHLTQNQSQKAQQQQKSLIEGQDDDVLTKGEMKKVLQQKDEEYQGVLKQYETRLSMLGMQSKHDDYEQVIQLGVEEAKKDSGLADALRSSSNPALLAYKIGKTHPDYVQRLQKQSKSQDAQKMVDNAQKPGAASQATGGTGSLGKIDWMKNLSDQEFEEHIGKVKRGLIKGK